MVIEARTLKGFRDDLPDSARLRQWISGEFEALAGQFCFQPVNTPVLEYADVLVGSGGTDKEVYRFLDHGEREVGLRFDLTVPFARFVTEHFDKLQFPLKRFQIGPVFRGEKPQKGRLRQFTQADIDIIGTPELNADIEVMSFMLRCFERILGDRFVMRINHRVSLNRQILESFGKDADQSAICMIIDKLDKVGLAQVKELLSAQGLSNVEAFVKTLSPDAAIGDEVAAIISLLKAEVPEHLHACIVPDPSLARGLGYYTGVVFEVSLRDHANYGSVGGGGRYDHLTERFGLSEMQGVGASMGVDRLMQFFEDFPEYSKSPKMHPVVYVIPMNDTLRQARALLGIARAAGILADIELKSKKLNKAMRRASQMQAKWVSIVGEDEAKLQRWHLKNMETGEELRELHSDEWLRRIQSP